MFNHISISISTLKDNIILVPRVQLNKKIMINMLLLTSLLYFNLICIWNSKLNFTSLVSKTHFNDRRCQSVTFQRPIAFACFGSRFNFEVIFSTLKNYFPDTKHCFFIHLCFSGFLQRRMHPIPFTIRHLEITGSFEIDVI